MTTTAAVKMTPQGVLIPRTTIQEWARGERQPLVNAEDTSAISTMTRLAVSLGLTESELFRQALLSFLYEKKREVLQLHLNILAQHGAESVADLESRISSGEVEEHPAWENLIVAENLAARLEELNGYLEALQGPTADRAA